MRKLFAILLFIVFAAPVFAAIATPEQLKIYQECLAAATNDLQRGDAQANNLKSLSDRLLELQRQVCRRRLQSGKGGQ